MVTVVLRWISLVVPKILVNVAVVMLCDDSSMTAFLNLWMAASGDKKMVFVRCCGRLMEMSTNFVFLFI